MSELPAEPCAACGRTTTGRRTWARDGDRDGDLDGDEVRWCSDGCRRRGLSAIDVTQGGRVVDGSAATGPVRVRRVDRSASG